jgi:plasmid stabilization system protein ParE
MGFDALPLAVREARSAWRWYVRNAGPSVADRFRAAFQVAWTKVETTPLACSPYHYGTRSCRLKRFPYHLVFVVEPNRQLVVAVAHFSRRPGYWRRRLP